MKEPIIRKSLRMSIKEFGDILAKHVLETDPKKCYRYAVCVYYYGRTASPNNHNKGYVQRLQDGDLYDGIMMEKAIHYYKLPNADKNLKDWEKGITQFNCEDYVTKRVLFNDWDAEFESEKDDTEEDLSIPGHGFSRNTDIVDRLKAIKESKEYRFDQITKFDDLKRKNQIWIENDLFMLKIIPSENMRNAIKSVPGYRYDGDRKLWSLPYSKIEQVKKLAMEQNFAYHEDAAAQLFGDLDAIEKSKAISGDLDVTEFKIEPYPYQKAGILFGMSKDKALIADEMGLGKTIQGIGIVIKKDAFPCLVVAPASLLVNWQQEWRKFTHFDPFVYHDTKANVPNLLRHTEVLIVSYEGAKKMLPYKQMFNSIIVDESHYIKSAKTQRFKVVYELSLQKKVAILLTGTPIMNKPIELVPQLKVLGMLKDMETERKFLNRYCGGKVQAENLEELNVKLRSKIMIRREKKDVLTELPDLTRTIVPIDIDTREEYNQAETDFIKYLKEVKNYSDRKLKAAANAEILVRLNLLKQISARGKVKQIVEFIKDANENDEKVIVFAHHRETIKSLNEALGSCYVITGSTDNSERQIQVNEFQKGGKWQNFLLSMRAASVGLTLTASSIEVFCELDWTPAIHDQCEARCHRIGQKNCVNAYYFLGQNTVDFDIMKIIDKKRNIINRSIGVETVIEQDESVISELLKTKYQFEFNGAD